MGRSEKVSDPRISVLKSQANLPGTLDKANGTCDNELPGDIQKSAQILWDYMVLGHPLKKSDVILVLGNHDLRTARYGAKLWLDGWAKTLMFSGKEGNYTRGRWDRSEAQIFREIAVEMGVPPEKIILEEEATNTGENVQLSQRKLKELDAEPGSIILVQMPVMERRTHATFMKQWRGASDLSHIVVTSPPMARREFPTEDVGDVKHTVTLLVECMERIISYPGKGFQVGQEIPDTVSGAQELLFKWCSED